MAVSYLPPTPRLHCVSCWMEPICLLIACIGALFYESRSVEPVKCLAHTERGEENLGKRSLEDPPRTCFATGGMHMSLWWTRTPLPSAYADISSALLKGNMVHVLKKMDEKVQRGTRCTYEKFSVYRHGMLWLVVYKHVSLLLFPNPRTRKSKKISLPSRSIFPPFPIFLPHPPHRTTPRLNQQNKKARHPLSTIWMRRSLTIRCVVVILYSTIETISTIKNSTNVELTQCIINGRSWCIQDCKQRADIPATNCCVRYDRDHIYY